MKYLIILLLVITQQTALSQTHTSTVVISDGISLTGIIKQFVPSKHNIDTCKDEFNNKYICKIDGKAWFGSDRSLELPRNQLVSLNIEIARKSIKLDVSKMFNVAYSFELQARQFKLKEIKGGHLLYSFFSDGAGTYTVYWKIKNNIAKRILISSDEKYFSWQYKK